MRAIFEIVVFHKFSVWSTFFFLFFVPGSVLAQDEYNFDELEQFEKKKYSINGHVELNYEHIDFNRNSQLYRLNFFQDEQDTMDKISGTLQLGGNYSHAKFDFNWLLEVNGSNDNTSGKDTADIFEAYGSIQPFPNLTIEAGKKVLKWGKGYAWNPVGFVERQKNPNDPNLTREGFLVLGTDYIRSFDSPLKTVALTTVLIPVSSDINEDFGEADHLNIAAKLYVLYRDTDIDFMVFSGGSRSNRLGVDFSRNISSNFEIHGELAWFPGFKKQVVDETGRLHVGESDHLSGLLGIRYLSENETTWIAELYHNDTGFSEEQMVDFYSFADRALMQGEAGDIAATTRALGISRKGYASSTPMRNYLYLKVSNKEPFDILYFTPSLATIINLDDGSFTLTPELLYKGFTDLEIRVRASLLSGQDLSEYGEKKNDWKFELRIRYSF